MYQTPRKKFTDKDIFPRTVQNYNKSSYKEDLLQQIEEKYQQKQNGYLNQDNYFATKVNSPYIEGFYFTPKKVDPQQEALNDLMQDMNNKASAINKIYDQLTTTQKKFNQNKSQQQSFSIFNKETMNETQYRNSQNRLSQYKQTKQDSDRLYNNKNNQYFFSQRFDPQNIQKNTLNKNLEIQPINQFDLEGVRDTIKERKFQEKKERFENYVENILPDELNQYIKDYFDNNFRKFKKDISQHQNKVHSEINELKNFTNQLKKGQERDALDLVLLKDQIKQFQQDEIHKRSDLFESLQKTNKKPNNISAFKYQTDRLKKKDILKEINNLL